MSNEEKADEISREILRRSGGTLTGDHSLFLLNHELDNAEVEAFTQADRVRSKYGSACLWVLGGVLIAVNYNLLSSPLAYTATCIFLGAAYAFRSDFFLHRFLRNVLGERLENVTRLGTDFKKPRNVVIYNQMNPGQKNPMLPREDCGFIGYHSNPDFLIIEGCRYRCVILLKDLDPREPQQHINYHSMITFGYTVGDTPIFIRLQTDFDFLAYFDRAEKRRQKRAHKLSATIAR